MRMTPRQKAIYRIAETIYERLRDSENPIVRYEPLKKTATARIKQWPLTATKYMPSWDDAPTDQKYPFIKAAGESLKVLEELGVINFEQES